MTGAQYTSNTGVLADPFADEGDQFVLLDDITWDPWLQSRAQIDLAVVAEYAEAMREGATFPPIQVFRDSHGDLWPVDGWHRAAAVRELGKDIILADVQKGERREAKLQALAANATHGLRRSNADKRKAVTDLLEDEVWRGWSDHEIARRAAVSQPFVTKVRGELTNNGYQSPTIRKGADGREIDTSNIGGHAQPELCVGGEPVDQVAELRFQERPADSPPPSPREVHHSSESVEWYTPDWILDIAREVMGSIDLDPASCESANERVKAARFYGLADDGLEQPWFGRVWLNPPYGRIGAASSQGRWSAELLDRFESGQVSEAMLLVKAVPCTHWFYQLWDHPIAFLRGRAAFIDPSDQDRGSPPHGTALVYLGPHWKAFRAVVVGLNHHVIIPERLWAEAT